MRGITPVIAIILLLLITVAAAGGFYFFYQSFSRNSQSGGSSQVQQVGTEALSSIKIESVAGGKVHVRNVGSTTLQSSLFSIYVDGIPVAVNVSAASLPSDSRIYFKFTQVPACTKSKCEVKITGAATTSVSVPPEKLICSSGSECSYNEVCSSGICQPAPFVGCGDNNCLADEYGWNCSQDCHPTSLLLAKWDAGDGYYLSDFRWSGGKYAWQSDFMSATANEWYHPALAFRANGDAVAASKMNNHGSAYGIWYSAFDGSTWASPLTVYSTDVPLEVGPGCIDADVIGNEIVAWKGYESYGDAVSWALIANGAVDTVYYNAGTTLQQPPAFAYRPSDSYHSMVYADMGPSLFYEVDPIVSFDSWEFLLSFDNVGSTPKAAIDYEPNGDAMVVMSMKSDDDGLWYLKYSRYNGRLFNGVPIGWQTVGNFEGYTPASTDIDNPSVKYDHLNRPIASVVFGALPNHTSYFTYNAGVGWSDSYNLPGNPRSVGTLMKAGDGTLFMPYYNYQTWSTGGGLEYWWTFWNGTDWSTPTNMRMEGVIG